MTDAQMMTLAFAVVFPLGMLLFSNSRITDTKETLRAEMLAMKAELLTALQRIENKIDHVAEVQANHGERLDRLERG